MCRYMCMCRYVDHTDPRYLQIHSDTYTYIQYLHIVTYLHIPAIPTHTHNTCTYLQYLYIHAIIIAIPAQSDTSTHTYIYMQCLHIPVIPMQTCIYLHIPAHKSHYCIYLQINAKNTHIHAHTCTYLSVRRFLFILQVSGEVGQNIQTQCMHIHAYSYSYLHILGNSCSYVHIP
jgi:hypothetical protein